MEKDKNSKIKVNFFTAKVSPAVFFILDFILTAGFLLLFDFIWSKARNEEFRFGILNVALPLALSVAGTIASVNNEKKGENRPEKIRG